MSGYKRVSYFELCRLCATNSQKEKTHIFHEEGKKIQLQAKIQTCLSLAVFENDCLPKVVCSKCVQCLDNCYSFQQECASSELMLSSYFKNFRYTDDFQTSGKVYIKDTKVNTQENATASTNNSVPVKTNFPEQIEKNNAATDNVPFYTLQLPTIVTNPNAVTKNSQRNETNEGKVIQSTQNFNINTIKQQNLVKPEILSNVVVNSNGEVINISQLYDFETVVNVKSKKSGKKVKDHKTNPVIDESIIKIDLTENTFEKNQSQKNKFFNIKVDDKNHTNHNATVIFSPVTNETNANFNNFTSSNSLFTQSNVNIINSNSSNNILASTNVIQSNMETSSTINLNILNQNLSDMNQNSFSNRSVSQTNYPNMQSFNLPNSSNVTTEKPNSDANTATTQSASDPPQPPPNEKSYICQVCKKGFKRREHLYQHMKLHSGFRPYRCDHCNKAFVRKEHLLRHMTLHSGQKNYVCNICQKSFSRRDNLLKHKKTHEKQSNFTCEICQKQFVMKHYYIAHKMTHGSKFQAGNWGDMIKT